MAQNFWYPPGSASAGSVIANQGTPNTDANAWPVRITDGTHDATVTVGGALNVAIAGGLTNPLPVTDASAEASLTSINTKIPSQGQAVMANSSPVVIASNQSTIPVSVASLPGPSGRSRANAPARNVYSSVNVTTGAYVQLVASLASTANLVEIFDSSGQTMALAVGAAASEVQQFYIFPGGNGQVSLNIPSGSRVSIIAISGTAAVGEIDVNFYT